MNHQPCAQSQTLCTSNVQSCCLLLGRGWGLEGVGFQRRAGKCNWVTGGLIHIPYCKGLYQRERSHLWGSTSVHNLRWKILLIATVPVKPLSGNGPWAIQDLQIELWAMAVVPLGGHWPVCSVFVSRSFPAQACTPAVWDVILLLDYFDPRTFAAAYQMMCLLVLAWCFSASKHGMVGGCKASLHFYATFTPL